MPPKRKSSLSRQTIGSRRMKHSRSGETEEQHENRLSHLTERRRETANAETATDRESRLRTNYESVQILRNNETTLQRHTLMERDRVPHINSRRGSNVDMQNGAFNYDSTLDYSLNPKITIGQMDVICLHCNAKKFPNEAPGMCCCNGKVSLPQLRDPPDPLPSLTSGMTDESKPFFP